MGFVVRVNVVWVVDGWDFVNWYMFVFIWVIVRCVYIVISFKMVLMDWRNVFWILYFFDK